VNNVDKDGLRALKRKYYRESAVVAEIQALLGVGEREQVRLFQQTRVGHTGDPAAETLVYFLRDALLRGDEHAAGVIMEALARRVIPTARKFLGHSFGLTTDQRDQIIETLFGELYHAWLSLEPEDEFWEVRFGVCLKMKLIAVVKRYRRPYQMEQSALQTRADGDEYDLTENLEDPRAINAELRLLVADALRHLEEPVRTAFYLYHREEWTEERIAAHLDVTDRTVRNYLRRAEQRLAEWRSME
jgi:RNA polymerase sigma factor (sigma-70 family)